MTLIAFILVLLSALLHATWNFLSKKGNPSAAFYTITGATAALATSVFFILSDFPLSEIPARFWMLYVLSVGFELCYVLGLAYGYRSADISLIYPLGRATPVLLVALVTIILGIGTVPGKMALIGMVIIFIGCIILPLKSFKNFSLRNYRSRALLFVVPIAVGTTGYTIIDSQAGKILQGVPGGNCFTKPMFYLFLIESGLAFSLFCVTLFSAGERQELKRLIKKPAMPMISGICSSTAYGLVLIAMGYVSNVCYLQAFRQLSLPFGVFLGIWFLKESPAVPKLIGVGLIVAGLFLTALPPPKINPLAEMEKMIQKECVLP